MYVWFARKSVTWGAVSSGIYDESIHCSTYRQPVCMINVGKLFGAICTLEDLCWCRPFVLQCRHDRGSTTPRTIALRFYARGMAVNLYRITSRTSIIECGMWIESLAPVELRRVSDPCSGLTNSRIVSQSSLFSIEPTFHRRVWY